MKSFVRPTWKFKGLAMDLAPDTSAPSLIRFGLGITAAFAVVVVIARDAKVRKLAQTRKVDYVAELTDTHSLASGHGFPRPTTCQLFKDDE